MITAVAFSVDGKTAAAGCFSGKVYFFSDSLSYLRSIKVKSTRGKNSKGKKITVSHSSVSLFSQRRVTDPRDVPLMLQNIQFLASSASVKDERVLITSNDSRVRLYRLADSALELKFKGHENESSQIGATMGDDGRWIVSHSFLFFLERTPSDRALPCSSPPDLRLGRRTRLPLVDRLGHQRHRRRRPLPTVRSRPFRRLLCCPRTFQRSLTRRFLRRRDLRRPRPDLLLSSLHARSRPFATEHPAHDVKDAQRGYTFGGE